MFLISPFAGILVDRFGCRRVSFLGGVLMTTSILSSSLVPSLTVFILLYGVAGGSGIGLLYSPTIVMVSRYFRKKHSIANGIALSGAGVGTMSLGPLSHRIIEVMGWRGYVRVYGCLVLLLTLLTLLYKPVNSAPARKGVTQMCTSKETVDNSADIKEGTEKSGQHKDQSTSIRTIVDWTIWRQASVLLFLGTAELFRLGFTVPMIHVVRFANDLKIASQDAALLVTYQGIGSLTGRISLGVIAANKHLKPMPLFWLCILMTGIPMLFAAQITSYVQLSVYIAFYGYFIGGQVTLQAVVLRQLVGADRLPQTLGWYMGLQAPIALVGGPIGGEKHACTSIYI
jgi:MFS family permease